jgi:hypothetical protein
VDVAQQELFQALDVVTFSIDPFTPNGSLYIAATDQNGQYLHLFRLKMDWTKKHIGGAYFQATRASAAPEETKVKVEPVGMEPPFMEDDIIHLRDIHRLLVKNWKEAMQTNKTLENNPISSIKQMIVNGNIISFLINDSAAVIPQADHLLSFIVSLADPPDKAGAMIGLQPMMQSAFQSLEWKKNVVTNRRQIIGTVAQAGSSKVLLYSNHNQHGWGEVIVIELKLNSAKDKVELVGTRRMPSWNPGAVVFLPDTDVLISSFWDRERVQGLDSLVVSVPKNNNVVVQVSLVPPPSPRPHPDMFLSLFTLSSGLLVINSLGDCFICLSKQT